jgi:hypothetical protein
VRKHRDSLGIGPWVATLALVGLAACASDDVFGSGGKRDAASVVFGGDDAAVDDVPSLGPPPDATAAPDTPLEVAPPADVGAADGGPIAEDAADSGHAPPAEPPQCDATPGCGNSCDPKKPESCKNGLVCHQATGTTPKCLPASLEGGACKVDGDCEGALVCNDADAKSSCAPVGQDGAACGEQGDCGEGLLCNAGTGACEPPGASGDGEPCAEDAHCADGLLCNTGTTPGACRPQGSAGKGKPCGDSYDCQDGLTCFQKKCQ